MADAPLPDLAKLKRYFTEARDLTVQARANSLSCIDYYDSDQFTADELGKLNARGQPAIVINRIKPAINGMIGVTEKGRSDPKAWPRNPGDADSADAATDVLRYIADFYWSNVSDAANVGGLSFASQQMATDTTIGVAALNNQLAFFGTASVEFWSPNTNAGPTDPAFTPNLSSSFQRGCAARDTIAYADNSLFWVGDNRVVYRVGNVPQRISSSSIEDKLRQCATIGACTAFVATFEGHEFYVLNIAGVGSYAYDISRIGTTAGAYGDSYERGEWSEWRSYGRAQFRGRCAAVWQGQVLIGDDTTSDIGAMQVGTWTDYGGPIERIASAFIKIEEGAPRCDSLVLHAVMGVGNPVDPGSQPVAELRWSDDQGRTFHNWRAAPLGVQGRYRNRAEWRRLGLMRAPGRLVEVRITDPVDAAISHLELNAARPGQ